MNTSAKKLFSLNQITEQILTDLSAAKNENHRIPIAVYGDAQRSNRFCTELAKQLNLARMAWVSEKDKRINNLFGKNASFVIGKEFDVAFFSFDQDSDVNLFTALAGTIVGGGLFVIIINPSLTNAADNSIYNFEARLLKILNRSQCINIHAKSDGYHIDDRPWLARQRSADAIIDYSEQHHAIDLIKRTAVGPANQPLVIKAQRGRGKSAALGIACAALIERKNIKIIVTAPTYAATTVLFKHFNAGAQPSEHIAFIAPDELVSTLPKANLLIIDEAASLPTPMLAKLLHSYNRMVFATTTHGYEGSGQSFTIRFKQYLDKITPKWQEFTLINPIRWSDNDPLESLINELFLLTSTVKKFTSTDNPLSKCHYHLLDRQTILHNEYLFSQLISILQLAHYKTRPSDIKQILNNSSYQLFTANINEQIIAVAIGISEGPIEERLAHQIYQGNRRPPGELLPQSLAFHLEEPRMAGKKYLRISRIAVLPELQHKGIGSRLLEYAEAFAKNNHFDAIGSSFGATPELLRFWLKKNYLLLRIGHSRKASSAMHAALLLKPFSDDMEKCLMAIQSNFYGDLQTQLTESLQNLEPDIVATIYRFASPRFCSIPTQRHWQNTYSFAFFNRSYEDCQSSLATFIRYAIIHSAALQDYNQQVLLAAQKVLQQKDWKDIVNNFNFSGKKQAQHYLRAAIAQLFITSAPRQIKKLLLNNSQYKYTLK